MKVENSRSRTGRKAGMQSGVTLMELLIAVAILALVITVAVPNMSEFGDSQRLLGASEQVYGHLQQARSVAIASSREIFVNFDVDGTADWVYGFSVNPLCDLSQTTPAAANACVIVVDDGDGVVDPGDGSVDPDDLVLSRFTGAEHRDVSMATASFSSGTTQIRFDPVRGTASTGQINLASGTGKQLRINVSILGRVTMCSPDGSITNYGTC